MPDVLSLWLPLLAVDTSSVRGLLGVILGVGALIFVHELGHFLAAKWAGVKVEVFSLGFGRRLFGFRRGETDYRVSLLPLGGYVRMLGQADDDPNQPATEDARDFRNKSAGKRFVILVAGVVMNLVFAAFAFVLAFGLGIEFTAPEVGAVEPGSPAARADLRPGDVVQEIDGSAVLGFQDLQTLVALSTDEMELKVLRGGQELTTRVKPFRGETDSYAQIGVAPARVIGALAPDSPLQGKVHPATPARSDRLLNVSPVDSRVDPAARMTDRQVARAIDLARGRVAITVERTSYGPGGAPTGVELVPLEVDVPQRPEFSLGLDLPDEAWVRRLPADGPAAKAGVEVGDRIVALGDVTPVTQSNLRDVVADVGARQGEAAVPLVVERPGADGQRQRVELQVSLELQNARQLEAALAGVEGTDERLAVRRAVGRWMLGIEYRADVVGAPSTLPLADEGAEPVTLQPGDRIVSVWLNRSFLIWRDEQPMIGPDLLKQVLRARGEEPLQLSWIPRGETTARTAVVRPFKTGETYGELGLAAMYREVTIRRGPLQAVALGMHQTAIQTQRIFMMLRSFLTGDVSPRELGGPIQIVSVAYTVATKDTFAKLLHLLAILSVNLAVINILPIPVLDGGHIFFLILEKLKGRPVSNDVLAYAQWVGLFMILGLMALVFFNDIRRVGLGQ
ncbi:MAG: RIP metalloprotease RseP [Planctomycetes bacterium]|nr:RIP metalloprotease RseP [Planctomycetota bacterium]